MSVLIGPAGTGKTTLLSILCSQSQIAQADIVLLAPTGKARVRMEQPTKGLKLKGFTVAKFLSPDRYDPLNSRYKLSDKAAEAGARTVIIDEASMLTEEMLADVSLAADSQPAIFSKAEIISKLIPLNPPPLMD